MRETIHTVLAFWFGADCGEAALQPAPQPALQPAPSVPPPSSQPDNAAGAASASVIAERQRALWWGKDAAVDAAIKARFEPLLLAAADNTPELAAWTGTAPGMLALILLFDQFPRNMYRGTAYAFGYDALARQCCALGLAQGYDAVLPPIQRVFFYMPLEHSEDPGDQVYSVKLFRALLKAAPAEDQKTFKGFADFAARHSTVIERFGRFPHRNALLGRDVTDEERAFLDKPGSSF